MVKIVPWLFIAQALMLQAAEPNLMPMPAKYTPGEGRLAIDPSFTSACIGQCEPRLVRTLNRFYERLWRQTGIEATPPLARVAKPTLTVEVRAASKPVQQLGEDESYTLEITSQAARLQAPTTLGALRGLETVLQLVQQDRDGFALPAVSIQDQPRFPWRGLMLDVSRHWMPMEVVKRTLDGMAAVKFNVFHWHLSDDQGFRVESKRYPKLHEMGSDGHYFTQAQVREVIEYARERGIRIVPEFDTPGHTTSWLVGYPEFGSAPGPYQIERHWGIFQPVLDPTREGTYRFLDGLIGEMAGLFPDDFFHVGGDEVEGKHWEANATIGEFMKLKEIKDRHELQRYFTRRVYDIVKKHGKRMEGWDEVLDPSLSKEIIIQSWRGQESLNQAVRQGYAGLLSRGYYLDLMHSAEMHYNTDPINEDGKKLSDEERSRILGGEACMWAEFVTPLLVDTRIWPRAAAIAERLWSPESVRDVRSMYARLDVVSRHLETVGLTHRQTYRAMLERLAGNGPVEPVAVLADIVEPVKDYTRGTLRDYTQSSPLNRLIDTAHPDSDAGRKFRYAVADKDWKTVRQMLTMWRDNDGALRPILETNGVLAEAGPLSANLTSVATIGLDALDQVENSRTVSPDWTSSQKEKLAAFRKPAADVLLMAVPGVESLVDAAGSTR